MYRSFILRVSPRHGAESLHVSMSPEAMPDGALSPRRFNHAGLFKRGGPDKG